MVDAAEELVSMLNAAERLRDMGERVVSIRPAPGKWSKKEILGHLIDSALNNHQRIVRLQLQNRLELPGYDQDGWVRINCYHDRAWVEIVDFWQSFNRQLATLVRQVDESCLRNVWRSPDGNDLDLEFIIRDYISHMRHHLDQILN